MAKSKAKIVEAEDHDPVVASYTVSLLESGRLKVSMDGFERFNNRVVTKATGLVRKERAAQQRQAIRAGRVEDRRAEKETADG